jgi:DNA-binding transcriptional MerR regulator
MKTIPDKLYYRIGEVARMAGVRTSVLRYWETEFAFLRPEKSRSGQRLYGKRDVELLLQVRRLLYDEKLTIEGVRKRFSSREKPVDREEQPVHITVPVVPAGQMELLRSVREELRILRSQM